MQSPLLQGEGKPPAPQQGKRVEVTVTNRQRAVPVTDALRVLLRVVAQACLAATGFPHDAQVALVGNTRIRDLNRLHRGKSAVTDVLSFPTLTFVEQRPILMPGDMDPQTRYVFMGDLAICMPRMKEQAHAYGHGETRELSFLMAHGMLHLLGMDHETEPEEKQMFALQEVVLSGLGLTREE
jgi:probable rRNA maturation factor